MGLAELHLKRAEKHGMGGRRPFSHSAGGVQSCFGKLWSFFRAGIPTPTKQFCMAARDPIGDASETVPHVELVLVLRV